MSSHVVSYALRFGTWPKTPTPSHVSIFLWMECIRTGSAQRQVPSVAVQIGTGPGLVSTFDSKQERQSSKLPPPRQRRAFAPGRRSVGLRASRNAEQAATRAAASAPDSERDPAGAQPPTCEGTAASSTSCSSPATSSGSVPRTFWILLP